MIEPVPIAPTALYDGGAVQLSLGISQSALAQARRAGRLRFTRQGNRVLYMGQWLIDWLQADSDQGLECGVPDHE